MKFFGYLLLVFFNWSVLQAHDTEEDFSSYFSLKIVLDEEKGEHFDVTLTNKTDETVKLYLNDDEVEGKFCMKGEDEQENSFYSKEYYTKLLTSVWSSGFVNLESKSSVSWEVKFKDLVFSGLNNKEVSQQMLADKTIYLEMHRFGIFTKGEKHRHDIDIKSNDLSIPLKAKK